MPGLDVEQLEGLLDFMAVHGLEEFEYDHGGLHIRLKKASAGPSAAPAARRGVASHAAPAEAAAATEPAPAQAREAAPAVPGAAAQAEELHVIKSPIVGTFYAAPSPAAAPFVKPGDLLKEGQVVCIVEAMKLMNEIEADISGELVQALVENGQPVEYGQGLFSVRPAKKKK